MLYYLQPGYEGEIVWAKVEVLRPSQPIRVMSRAVN